MYTEHPYYHHHDLLHQFSNRLIIKLSHECLARGSQEEDHHKRKQVTVCHVRLPPALPQ